MFYKHHSSSNTNLETEISVEFHQINVFWKKIISFQHLGNIHRESIT